MTTDPFTDAARAEAERRVMGSSRFAHTTRDLLVGMAEWARTHLAAQETDGGRGPRTTAAIREWTGAWPAAQEPTDAEVEAACVGFYNDPNGLTDWTKLARVQPDLADKYRAGIRRALSAARAARRDEEKR